MHTDTPHACRHLDKREKKNDLHPPCYTLFSLFSFLHATAEIDPGRPSLCASASLSSDGRSLRHSSPPRHRRGTHAELSTAPCLPGVLANTLLTRDLSSLSSSNTADLPSAHTLLSLSLLPCMRKGTKLRVPFFLTRVSRLARARHLQNDFYQEETLLLHERETQKRRIPHC